MDPARRAAGKKPDAAAPGNARIVPRLFTSALGGGLSAWAHVICGDSEARLRRLLLGSAKLLSPWRQAKAETRRAVFRFPDASQLEPTISTGSRQLSPQVATALLSKVRAELTSQQAQIVDTLKRQCPGFAVMRKLVFSFRAILRGGQGDHPPSLDGRGAQDKYPFTGALCPNFETGPKRSGSGGERTVEQRAGRGTT